MAEVWIFLPIFLMLIAAVHVGRLAASRLPAHYAEDQTKESVKRATDFLMTITALLLGLLIATGKSTFDKKDDAVSSLSAKIALVDELLAHYGPDADQTRQELKHSARQILTSLWSGPAPQAGFNQDSRSRDEQFLGRLFALHPATEAQVVIKAQAITVANAVIEDGFKLATMEHSVAPPRLLVVIVVWLAIIFVSLGFCSSASIVAGISEYVGVFAASTAMLLVLEYDHPFSGLLQMSRRSLDVALAALGP